LTIDFPCEYPLKVIAENFPGIQTFVFKVIDSNNVSYIENSLITNFSRSGKYCSVRVSIIATGNDQIAKLNKEFMSEPRVRLVL
tara:strand:+ start:220 stop:471 length:252 start_codon:yes stop_codon:yes gene_type:complete